jgi:hypothetical protein
MPCSPGTYLPRRSVARAVTTTQEKRCLPVCITLAQSRIDV